MPLHDLGYRGWDGDLNPLSLRWLVIAETGVRLAWRSRWLRRMLVLAWLPAVAAGVFFFVAEKGLSNPRDTSRMLQMASREFPVAQNVAQRIAEDPESARSQVWTLILMTLFRMPQGVLIIVLVALIAPPLIAQDMRSRAFLLYFSRPITRLEYIIGKIATVSAYVAMVTALPGLGLYCLGVAMSPSLNVVWDTWDIPLRVLAASTVVIIPTTTFALALSALLGESRFATFCWFAPWVMGFFAYGAMTSIQQYAAHQNTETPFFTTSKWSVVSPYHALGEVQGWVFGIDKFDSIASDAFLLSAVTAVSMAILLRKVAAPMRV